MRRPAFPAWKKVLSAGALLLFLAGTGVFVYYYVRFSRVIDARLSGEIFNHASMIFSAPTPVWPAEPRSAAEIVAKLRRAGYSEANGPSDFGSYRLKGNRLEIYPGPASFFRSRPLEEGPAALEFRNGQIASITALQRNAALESYILEPEFVTTLFDRNRAKRRLVRYQDLPKVLVDAVLATEDHRFFSHHGVNFYRILAAAVADLRAEERLQGGSTLTMQLARNFFLTPRRTIRRKLEEIFLALLLEQRLSKEQIFELYANQVYLGQRGSFAIYGFGEAANAYFNKDVSSLTLAEASLLAGLIRGPNLYSPYKYPGRALERRNFVLKSMAETGYVAPSDAARVSASPLGLVRQNVEGTDAPYFVDMVRDQLLAQFSERDLLSQSYKVYTTLDVDLERAATEAVRAGMQEVDKEVAKHRNAKGATPPDPNQPQVALLALDAHSGNVEALVGGRGYAVSQLNHVLSRRQPGSSFKPFVYAAALSSAVDGSQPLITPATTLDDEPTSFQFGGQTYEPENYKHEYHGQVTVREALTHSLNVATVRLAEMVGYEKVRALAIGAGLTKDLLATPALALGAYVATPLEVAGAYMIFSNGGEFVAPKLILAVKDNSGEELWQSPTITRRVLDPRVSYLMVSLLESVINNGTGAGVRSRGFTPPAAGKTGTSHDGWFAGFTSNLLAVVWVGYDDDRELKLPGASSALPVWSEFMKRATEIPEYENAEPFSPPAGIVTVPIDTRTNLVASAESPLTRNEVFIEGTEPRASSLQGGALGILSRIFHLGSGSAIPAAPTAPVPTGQATPEIGDPTKDNGGNAEPSSDHKPGGVVRKFLSIFKRKGSKAVDQPQPAGQTNP